MCNIFIPATLQNNKGFSLLEVLLGVTVFMIGMLGVTALNISSLKSNTFSGNMSEATILASDKIEELMALDYDHSDLDDTDGDGTNQDTNNNGLDDDNPDDTDYADDPHDTNQNFGLDDNTAAKADHTDPPKGKNDMYNIYWNVANGEPLPLRTKTVNVIVEWEIKGVKRQMNIESILVKDEAE